MQIKYHTTHKYIPAAPLASSRLILLGMEAASLGSRQKVPPNLSFSSFLPRLLCLSLFPTSTYHHCLATLPTISQPFFMCATDGRHNGKISSPCTPTVCPCPYLCTRVVVPSAGASWWEVGVDAVYMRKNMTGIKYEMERWALTSTEGGNPSSMNYRCMLNHILMLWWETSAKIIPK